MKARVTEDGVFAAGTLVEVGDEDGEVKARVAGGRRCYVPVAQLEPITGTESRPTVGSIVINVEPDMSGVAEAIAAALDKVSASIRSGA